MKLIVLCALKFDSYLVNSWFKVSGFSHRRLTSFLLAMQLEGLYT